MAVDSPDPCGSYSCTPAQPGDIDIDDITPSRADAVRSPTETHRYLVLLSLRGLYLEAGFTGAENSARLPPGRRSLPGLYCCSFPPTWHVIVPSTCSGAACSVQTSQPRGFAPSHSGLYLPVDHGTSQHVVAALRNARLRSKLCVGSRRRRTIVLSPPSHIGPFVQWPH